MKKRPRIGIYAGTFNPVHSGHIAFALQAIQAVRLDKVCFLPERQPRAKQEVEHFGHRMGMLRQALKPHPRLEAMELVDVNFSVKRTLPQLRQKFPGSQLIFLFGSDIVPGLAGWPYADQFLEGNELVIGVRSRDKREDLRAIIETWKTQPTSVTIFDSYAPDISSGIVREALRTGQAATPGLLKSVERYSDRHWLYVSLA
ncbi:MAG TPA: nicotinate-nicotinamide nucleotide adenylyltransferase [Candidatus Saccharimonadales bacterium]|nr:nicotinate-nicotinamide nucleotide adenylyltransferase [Candidatus Saccharimonadales bacterium]